MDGALHGDQDLAGIRKIIQSLLEKKRYFACHSASLFSGQPQDAKALKCLYWPPGASQFHTGNCDRYRLLVTAPSSRDFQKQCGQLTAPKCTRQLTHRRGCSSLPGCLARGGGGPLAGKISHAWGPAPGKPEESYLGPTLPSILLPFLSVIPANGETLEVTVSRGLKSLREAKAHSASSPPLDSGLPGL